MKPRQRKARCKNSHDRTKVGALFDNGNCKQCHKDNYLRRRESILERNRARRRKTSVEQVATIGDDVLALLSPEWIVRVMAYRRRYGRSTPARSASPASAPASSQPASAPSSQAS